MTKKNYILKETTIDKIQNKLHTFFNQLFLTSNTIKSLTSLFAPC